MCIGTAVSINYIGCRGRAGAEDSCGDQASRQRNRSYQCKCGWTSGHSRKYLTLSIRNCPRKFNLVFLHLMLIEFWLSSMEGSKFISYAHFLCCYYYVELVGSCSNLIISHLLRHYIYPYNTCFKPAEKLICYNARFFQYFICERNFSGLSSGSSGSF